MREKSSFINERGLQLLKLKFFCPPFLRKKSDRSRGGEVNLAYSTSEEEISFSLKKAKIIPL